jgi:uncharacterized protein YbjT (DUF2867 family)
LLSLILGVRDLSNPISTAHHAYSADLDPRSQHFQLTNSRWLTYVRLDSSDPSTLCAAFTGADYCYLIIPLVENSLQIATQWIDSCKKYGVKFVVKLSSIVASKDSPSFTARNHFYSENYLNLSKIPHATLASNIFADNYLRYDLEAIHSKGLFFGASGEGKTAYIDCRDIADIVAAILSNLKEFEGQTIILTGAKSYSDCSAAAFISNAAQKEVRFISWPADIHLENLQEFGVEKWLIQDLTATEAMKKAGKLASANDSIQRILNRPPISLEQHISDYSEFFRGREKQQQQQQQQNQQFGSSNNDFYPR